MSTAAIHRIVEQHAAARGDMLSLVDGSRRLSYRELNYAANTVARRLFALGLRRGGHATVRMRRGLELAVTLLAILKAGGSYTWRDPERDSAPDPEGASLTAGAGAAVAGDVPGDAASVLAAPIAYSPNLPVVARGCDVACVLAAGDGSPAVLVPHATVTTLRARAVPHPTPWVGDAGAFDLWMALMAGTTAVVDDQAAAIVAAA